MKSVNEMHLSKTNRIFYISEGGELFVQFRPNKQDELKVLEKRVNVLGEIVYYIEELVSGNIISGYVTRVTKSGVALKEWSIK